VLDALEVTGPRLAGDQLRLEPVTGSWDLAETPGAGAGSWVIRRLDLGSPIFSLKTNGPLPAPPGTAGRIEGTLDLAALARQIPHRAAAPRGDHPRSGLRRVRAESRAETDRSAWEVEADVSDLLARDGDRAFTLEAPATFTARIEGRGRAWALKRLAVRTAFLEATGEGNLDDGVTWTAKLDLGGLQHQLHDLIDFGTLELAGKGDLSGDYHRQGPNFAARLTAALRDLRVGGLASGTLKRNEVRLEAALDGPAGDTGLPRAWDRLQLGLRTGTIAADLSATARGRVARGDPDRLGPVRAPGSDGRVEARVAARWDDAGATIEQARLAIVPDGPESGGEPIAIAAQGRFDRARGELVLKPAPTPAGAKSEAIALGLAPDGVRIAGIGRGGAMRVDAALAGDLAALGRVVRSWDGAILGDPAGRWSAHATLQEVDDGWQIGGKLEIPELVLSATATRGRSRGRSAWGTLRGPVGLSLKAHYQPEQDRLDLAELVPGQPVCDPGGIGPAERPGRRAAGRPARQDDAGLEGDQHPAGPARRARGPCDGAGRVRSACRGRSPAARGTTGLKFARRRDRSRAGEGRFSSG